ncbi:MAG: sugar transferase [Candidatus Latescibacterota bacterium]|nr:MAG: sugar transferase [Candidatus Latescibacterota bacterium]
MNRPSAKASQTSIFPDWITGVGGPPPAMSERVGRELGRSIHGVEGWKRGLDIVLSVSALVLCAPAMILVAALVKLTSPGPVLFKQERIGLNRRLGERRNGGPPRPVADRRNGNGDRRAIARHGKPFTMYKFRSMTTEAENGDPQWTIEEDPRVTPLGRVLRKTRFDETPQFFNVLRGDMSFVGPRPERGYFYGKIEKDVPCFPVRLRAKPGITGLAQVNLGYCNTVPGMTKKLQHDLEYIRTVSPATDAKILLRTVSVVLTGKGAF